jgi:hypothetical protein
MKYKVIIRDPGLGTEKYVDGLTRAKVIEEAAKMSMDDSKQVYIEWTDIKEDTGYLNRDGSDCPGEPW